MGDELETHTYESVPSDQQAYSTTPTTEDGQREDSSSLAYNEMYAANIIPTRQPSNEYQLLQRNRNNIQENITGNGLPNKSPSELKQVKHGDSKIYMNRIIFTAIAIVVIALLTATVAIILSALSFRELMSGEEVIAVSNDMLSLQNEIANLQLQINCGRGEWSRLAFLNMSDPSQQCPSAWKEYNTSGIRACGRRASSDKSCSSTFYSTTQNYRKVCGQVVGYQLGSPDGFNTGNRTNADGIQVLLGASSNHIWSYVAGVTESSVVHARSNCPCFADVEEITRAPPSIGNNYYCESGNPTLDFTNEAQLYSGDRLWDGQQCENEGTCCTGTNIPPWFSVQLPAPTNEAIEVRICGEESTNNEDTPVELLEILVQEV